MHVKTSARLHVKGSPRTNSLRSWGGVSVESLRSVFRLKAAWLKLKHMGAVCLLNTRLSGLRDIIITCLALSCVSWACVHLMRDCTHKAKPVEDVMYAGASYIYRVVLRSKTKNLTLNLIFDWISGLFSHNCLSILDYLMNLIYSCFQQHRLVDKGMVQIFF